MNKLDLKKQFAALYAAKAGAPSIVTVPSFGFLMIDGEGDPNTMPAYQQAVQALFTVSYALKFRVKKGPAGVDYGVMPLEGLWWADDPQRFATNDRTAWRWTMMVMQTGLVTPALVAETLEEVRRKKRLPALDAMRYQSFEEGDCVQVLHVGPFTTEAATIEALHTFVAEAGAELRGVHHEIYLSDIEKTEPSRWKTILRQPITR